ncbi:MAG: zinc-ribbon domain-containing protein [Candidatus Bathyarchaeota archaeon]|nr:zinc-ribbon domain-containing protein [Candidatus Bathyarchaeota archaeon]
MARLPYCEKCGGEIEEDARFCPHCGAPVGETSVTYRRPPRRAWAIGRILAVFFGGVIILASFGLLAGGGAIMWAHCAFSNPNGFLISREVGLQVDSYAMVLRGADFDVNVPDYFWAPKPGRFVTVKLVGRSNDPSKEIFMGIARDEDARGYLDGVEYDEVVDSRWSYSPWRDTQPRIEFEAHQGGAPSGPPTIHSFWAEHATGSGTQTLKWESDLASFLTDVGNLWVVTMNADGSAGVDLTIQFGAKVPILRTVGGMLLAGGFTALAVGGLIIYLGAYRPRS